MKTKPIVCPHCGESDYHVFDVSDPRTKEEIEYTVVHGSPLWATVWIIYMDAIHVGTFFSL